MSKKQEIYVELLKLSIPASRNILSNRFVYGKNRKIAYDLCQLTHNLYISILSEDFIEHDFWFLNVHSKSYYEKAQNTELFELIVSLLRELFDAVPENLRCKLKWSGP